MALRERTKPKNRIWNVSQLAAYLGHSDQWLREHMRELEMAGMPRRNEVLDGWDSEAIKHWLDRKSGLVRTIERADEAQRMMLERTVAYGQTAIPVS